jgi:hypothetical protein
LNKLLGWCKLEDQIVPLFVLRSFLLLSHLRDLSLDYDAYLAALVTSEVHALLRKLCSLLLGPCERAHTQVSLIDRHEGDQSVQNVPDCPSWLPILRMEVSEGEADLLLHLEPPTWSEELNVGRSERVAAWESDDSMVEASFEV